MGRVLLCDDEPAVLFTLKEVLVERGHEAVTAASGREALGRLDGVDAAITDLAMPGMDGLALLAAIRERDPSLPVVLLTAHGSEKVAVQAMKAGAYDYADQALRHRRDRRRRRARARDPGAAQRDADPRRRAGHRQAHRRDEPAHAAPARRDRRASPTRT